MLRNGWCSRSCDLEIRQPDAMSIIARYFMARFASRFLLTLAVLSSALILADLLANADEVMAASESGVSDLLVYVVLKSPIIVSKLITLSALLGALLALATLVRHQELVAARGVGISQSSFIGSLIPVALLIAIPQVVLNDTLVPRAMAELRDRSIENFGYKPLDNRHVWLKDGSNIVRIERVAPDRLSFTNVSIFERNAEGNLLKEISADEAETVAGGWRLRNAVVLEVESGTRSRHQSLDWSNFITPQSFRFLSSHPRELGFRDLISLLEDPLPSLRPPYVIEAWLHRKIAGPVATILILLIAVPLAQRFSRTSGLAMMFVAGAGVWFAFFTFDSIVFSAGEAGLLPPIAAAWIPTGVLACLGGTLFFFQEGN